MSVLVECGHERGVIEVRLVAGKKDDRVALRKRINFLELRPVVLQSFTVSAGIHETAKLRAQVDEIGTVHRRYFRKVRGSFMPYLRCRSSTLPSQARDPAAK